MAVLGLIILVLSAPVGLAVAWRYPTKSVVILFLVLPVYHVGNAIIFSGLGSIPVSLGIRFLKDALVWTLLLMAVGKALTRHHVRVWSALDWLVASFGILSVLSMILGFPSSWVAAVGGLRQNLTIVAVYLVGRSFATSDRELVLLVRGTIILAAASGAVALGEFLGLYSVPDMVGLMDYYERAYGASVSGEFGLTWTFQTAFGWRRYSGLFGNPLEAAAVALWALALWIGVEWARPRKRGGTGVKHLGSVVWILVGLVLSFSRSSIFAGGLLLLSLPFFRQLGKIRWLPPMVVALGLAVVWMTPVLRLFVIATVSLVNPSAAGHAREWEEAIRAVMSQPVGLGLGTSGPVAARFGTQIGGENMFLITAVQMGVVGLLLYASMWLASIKLSLKVACQKRGYVLGAVAFALFLGRLGMVVPASTSAFETYLSVSLPAWWLLGVLARESGRSLGHSRLVTRGGDEARLGIGAV